MIIAIDFDGTIVEHEYPKIGKPIPFAIETLLHLQKDGHILILWTVRDSDSLQEAIDYCKAKFPDATTTIWAAAIDPLLNEKAYIVPGLGDAGDLAYGQKD